MEWVILKMFLSLAAVLGLMAALVYVMKKFFYGGRSKAASIVDIEILGSHALAPKRSVYVLQVAEKVIVVGMTEQGMHPLAEMESAALRKERMSGSLDDQSETDSVKSDFSTYLGKHLNAVVFKGGLRPRKA